MEARSGSAGPSGGDAADDMIIETTKNPNCGIRGPKRAPPSTSPRCQRTGPASPKPLVIDLCHDSPELPNALQAPRDPHIRRRAPGFRPYEPPPLPLSTQVPSHCPPSQQDDSGDEVAIVGASAVPLRPSPSRSRSRKRPAPAWCKDPAHAAGPPPMQPKGACPGASPAPADGACDAVPHPLRRSRKRRAVGAPFQGLSDAPPLGKADTSGCGEGGCGASNLPEPGALTARRHPSAHRHHHAHHLQHHQLHQRSRASSGGRAQSRAASSHRGAMAMRAGPTAPRGEVTSVSRAWRGGSGASIYGAPPIFGGRYLGLAAQQARWMGTGLDGPGGAQGLDAMRQHLRLMLTDRDFDENDYEMLLRLDETVDNRRGAAPGEIDALGSKEVAGEGPAGSSAVVCCSVCLEDVVRCVPSFHSAVEAFGLVQGTRRGHLESEVK